MGLSSSIFLFRPATSAWACGLSGLSASVQIHALLPGVQPLVPICVSANWPRPCVTLLQASLHLTNRAALVFAAGAQRMRDECTRAGVPPGAAFELFGLDFLVEQRQPDCTETSDVEQQVHPLASELLDRRSSRVVGSPLWDRSTHCCAVWSHCVSGCWCLLALCLYLVYPLIGF
jgi:hypothetical protein